MSMEGNSVLEKLSLIKTNLSALINLKNCINYVHCIDTCAESIFAFNYRFINSITSKTEVQL